MKKNRIQHLFEKVVLGEFAVYTYKKPSMLCKIGKSLTQKADLLNAFFERLVVPLFDGTMYEAEIKKTEEASKKYFAASVINELYTHIIEPYLNEDSKRCYVESAVILMAASIIENHHKEPFASACKAVLIERAAPFMRPYLRPERVRTYAEELILEGCLIELEKWGKDFCRMCKDS